ncbi:UDP-N-acetyl-D-mannosamine dehydrogenase [compost metagenome]
MSHPGRTIAVEPNIEELPKHLHQNLELFSLEKALLETDIIVLLVDHKEFKEISKNAIINKKTVDTRGIWDL